MKVRRGLVITGGLAAPAEWYNSIKSAFDVVVAADSGLDTAEKLHATVDQVVGDMDSLQNLKLLEKMPDDSVHRYETEKDCTDTEIGLKVLTDMGCSYRCVYGGGGGRLDHLFGLLSLFERETTPDLWITDSAVVITIKTHLRLTGLKNQIVSFFPVGKELCTMRSYGLKWKLSGLEWRKGDAGVSNEIDEDTMDVKVLSGRLICVGGLGLLEGFKVNG